MEDPFNEPTHIHVRERYAAGMKLFNGRFVLERRLGRGGMGEVWQATDTELGDYRALKFLPPEIASDPVAVGRLRREALAGRKLTHPRIVKTDDFYVQDEHAAVVMECVEGKTLYQIQSEEEKGYFDVKVIEPWIMDVCEALDYAHGEVRVAHRDIKPKNILIDEAAGRAKLVDFGISSRISDTYTRTTGRDTGGALAYMGPQQLCGERCREQDDIYSMGATIYELLTGVPPFFRGDLRMQIANVTPPRMAERRADLVDEHLVKDGGGVIPEAWERAVAACLAKQRADRPGSGQDLANRLDERTLFSPFQAVVDEPEERPRVEPAREAQGRGKKRRAGVWVGLVVLCILGAVIWAMVPGGDSPASNPDQSSGQEARQLAVANAQKKQREQEALAELGKKAEGYAGQMKSYAGADTVEISSLEKCIAQGRADEKREQESKAALARLESDAQKIVEDVESKLSAKDLVGAKGEIEKLTTEYQQTVAYRERKGLQDRIETLEKEKKSVGEGHSEIPGIPQDWVDQGGDGVIRYAKYIQSLRLRNITPRMVLEPHFLTLGGIENSLPPRAYWKHIAPTLKVVDKLIAKVGAPLKKIHYAYCSPRFNRAVDQLGHVQHTQNRALKISLRNVSPHHVAYVAKQLRDSGYFKGGIGLYSEFVHIDTGGKDAYWVVQKNKLLRSTPRPRALVVDEKENGNGEGEPDEKQEQGKQSMEGKQAGERRMFNIGGQQVAFRWCPPTTSAEWKKISGGNDYFLMGSPTTEKYRGADEAQHQVVLTEGFWLMETEVTQGLWRAVVGSNPSEFKNAGLNAPVERVSWNDAQKFLNKVNDATTRSGGWTYVLPTEAQWEYACRAGTITNYSNGEQPILGGRNCPGLSKVGWYGGNSGITYEGGMDSSQWVEKEFDHKRAGIHPVAQKQPNEWGLHDMHGNLSEWCRDIYGVYPQNRVKDPVGAKTGKMRVHRGGDWCFGARQCRSASRSRRPQDIRFKYYIGFRMSFQVATR